MMDELKKSLEVVLTTLKTLEGKDQLVIFLFVRSVLEHVESCLVTGNEYSIPDVFTDCCTVFQEADDVLVEKTEDSIKVEAIKDGTVEKSYSLSKQNTEVLQTECDGESEKTKTIGDQPEQAGPEDSEGMYYLSIPNTEDGEGPGGQEELPPPQEVGEAVEGSVEMPQGGSEEDGGGGVSGMEEPPQTVLECSDPSVLQAFLEEGGKLPSYMPPGTQIIIETKDGRTEVIQNTAVVQSDVLDPVSVKQESGGESAAIPVFVMTEDGSMLVSTESKGQVEGSESVTMAAADVETPEAPPVVQTPRGRGRPRKRPLGGISLGTKKLKLEDGSDASKTSDSGLTFQCDQCFQYFAHEHSLHRHYRAVHMNMKWTCEDCGREFTRPDSLVNHKKKQSCFKGPGKPTIRFDPNEKFVEGQGYLCELCDIFFRNLGALKRHRETQHSGIAHECEDCGKKFTASSYLATHKKQACVARDSVSHEEALYTDKQIKTETESKEGEKEETAASDNEESQGGEHEATLDSVTKLNVEDVAQTKLVSGGKKSKREPGEILPKDPNDVFLCEDCGKCLSSKQALIIHMRKHTGEVPFKCQFCGHGANTRGNLLRHLESIHGVTKGDPNIKLDLTNYGAVHMRIHTKEMPYSCDYCDHCFATKANKLRHEQTVHEHRKDWECDECDRKFTEKKTMLKHKQVCHLGERPYRCDMCEKTFSYKGALQTHIASHSGDKPHRCEFCSLSFTLKHQLKSHMKVSHPDEDLSCPVCDRSFVKYDDLEKHMKVHEDPEKKCQLCNAKFSLKQELTEHIKAVHTKEKPFRCRLCEGVSFYSRNALNRHMESEHTESQELDNDDSQVNGDTLQEETEPNQTLEMSVEEEDEEREAEDAKEAITKADLLSEEDTSGDLGLDIKTETVEIPTPGKGRGRGRPPKVRS